MEEETGAAAPQREVALLGGGCFWCLEAVFRELRGVERVRSGYAGGDVANPDYRRVCGGGTGHAEVVEIAFDPRVIGYRDILEVFFAIHDPTTRDRQGNDVGTQYRSVIFFHTPGQEAAARAMIGQLAGERVFRDPIVTQVLPAPAFWVAEDYHQDYFRHNAAQPYCQVVVAPKLTKFREKFRGLRRG